MGVDCDFFGKPNISNQPEAENKSKNDKNRNREHSLGKLFQICHRRRQPRQPIVEEIKPAKN
jgi:hypothetical protein